MSDETGNGKPTEEEKESIVAETPKAAPVEEPKWPENEAYIENDVMTIKLYMWGDAAFAKSVGSLFLAMELVKTHFGAMALKRQMEKPKIIRPTMH